MSSAYIYRRSPTAIQASGGRCARRIYAKFSSRTCSPRELTGVHLSVPHLTLSERFRVCSGGVGRGGNVSVAPLVPLPTL